MAYDKVVTGPYQEFTFTEVIAALAKVDAAIAGTAAGTGQIISVSENGKSVSFAANTSDDSGGLAALRRQRHELLQALAQVSDDYSVTTNTAYATFGGCRGSSYFPYW